ENVDRLLKSPTKQRGRDFAIMLKTFSDLDYSVEWRVINAADYGQPQRRRRLFFFVYRNDTKWGKSVNELLSKTSNELDSNSFEEYIYKKGLFARQFPRSEEHTSELQSRFDIV